MDDSRRHPGHPAGTAAARAARRRPVRHFRPERSLSPRHQPQQPVEEADRAEGARRHHPQRKAHAPGSGRCAVRQRPPRPRAARRQQPSAQVAVRYAQGQAGAVPSEPARQARRLLRPFGHRRRSRAEAASVRSAEEDGARAVQAVHLQQARRARSRRHHQAGEGDGRTAASRSVGRARRGHSRAPGAAEPRADAASARHPGVRAGAGRGQGDPHPSAGLHGVQRRLRRRPDGRPHPAVARSADRSLGADAVVEQHPVAGARRADRDSVAGHRPRLLLPDQGQERRQGRGPGVRQSRRRDAGARGGRTRNAVADPAALHRRPAGPDRVARRPGRAPHRSADGQEQDHQHHRRPRHPEPGDAGRDAVRQRPAEEEGAAAAGAVLLPEVRAREDRRDARLAQECRLHVRDQVGPVDRHRRPDHPEREGAARREGARRGHQGRIAVPRRRDHQRRALQQGHRDLVGGDRRHRQRDVQRDGSHRQGRPAVQPGLHHGRLRRARFQAADPSARRYARADGQAVRRDHRDADHRELPRRPRGAALLHLDARRAQGSGRHGAQDRRLGLPDAPSGRRGAGRHHPRERLRHGGRHRSARHRRIGRDHRAAPRPHHRPRRRSRRSPTRSPAR